MTFSCNETIPFPCCEMPNKRRHRTLFNQLADQCWTRLLWFAGPTHGSQTGRQTQALRCGYHPSIMAKQPAMVHTLAQAFDLSFGLGLVDPIEPMIGTRRRKQGKRETMNAGRYSCFSFLLYG
jgi:hypothetical protein